MISLKIPQSILFLVSMVVFSPYAIAADLEDGKAKAVMCQGCHGVGGVSNNPIWPSLAGQQSAYLEKQMKAFKSGTRKDPTMKGVVAALNEQDFENLAAYFATQSAKSAGGDANLAKTGKGKVTLCMGCHGSDLQGRDMFPRLAGQQPQYLIKQLTNFKKGIRMGGPMGGVTKSLSEQDIKAISAFLGTL